jgi:hypothetical protein
MKKHHTARLLFAAMALVCAGASAQSNTTSVLATARTGQASPTFVIIESSPTMELVNKTIVTYSNVTTYQFAFSVLPDAAKGGYMFGTLNDSWQLYQMHPKRLSPEVKHIIIKVINNAAVPSAVGTKAELEAIGRVMLSSARAQGFDVSGAKIVTSQANGGLIDLDRHSKANVLVSISTREGE